MNSLIQLRHTLHKHPEIAGEESQTAQRILDFFKPLNPDETIEGLGGTGLAFIFKGKNPGKRLLFRCELDALPIEEKGNPSYQSTVSGKAHLCGHDGHMAIICGLGEKLAQERKYEKMINELEDTENTNKQKILQSFQDHDALLNLD